ncbi:hypothetical protein Nepgr_001239 [Nepenthes gracilis]|uniref:Vacuolar membrane protease n=1 Tax=Nepenthes gracilis TaxID=150966 RepID=A0AAD3P2G3_NEPGR|nr:hypothetical protein Nepgr_001239 [Nepenthes gracilis]
MRQRNSSSETPSSHSNQDVSDSSKAHEEPGSMLHMQAPKRSSYVMLSLFVVMIYSSWGVYHYQYESLPMALTAEQASKRGFSEIEAMKHVKALANLGPHSVGSDALDLALQYVRMAADKIKSTSHWEVDVEVDLFHVMAGANRLHSGLFMGKTLIYADLNHVVLRVSPKYSSEAKENSILVSSHIDTVFSTGGAGDCSSCVAVMLELARGISQWAHGFKNSIVFLFNTGEEEGLNGAHSFITQHPWSGTVRMAIDLEAMGIGGKSGIFQAGPHSRAIENFAMVAKYPSGQIIAQDLFSSGVIKSATDFQLYKEVAGLSGLDFAYVDNTAVYHTKNDKLELLKAGSLQHLGENMLAFLLQTAASPLLVEGEATGAGENTGHDPAVYFDILGTYMVVYHQRFANMLHNSVIAQSLLIWTTSLLIGGYPAAISLALSLFSVIIMWILSVSFSILVAFILPYGSSSAVPYVTSPWLVVGLFGSPSLLGALAGQHIGFLILQMYLSRVHSKGEQTLSLAIQADLVKLEAERWLFKSGIVQWLVILLVSNYYNLGSSYLPLIWLASPAFAYGLLEATLSPTRFPKPLKITTLLIGLSLPILVSAGATIRVMGMLIGSSVRLDRNPGGTPEWLSNVIVAVIVAAVVCLMLVYLLSYVHLSGAKRSVIVASCILFGLSLTAVWSGIIPPFTEDTARTVNVVHVVDATGSYGEMQKPFSYVSLFSNTPGKLTREIEKIKEGFGCGRDKTLDFVTFSVKYGCWTYDDSEGGWSMSDIPTLLVESDTTESSRVTQVSIDTKVARRWSLAINTEEIEDFQFIGDSKELIPQGNKSSIGGRHIIQFSGGKNAPSKFNLILHWARNSTQTSSKTGGQSDDKYLLKLRTDVDKLTPKVERILVKLPSWCSPFGKSTSPYTLAFLASLPTDF